MSTALDKIKSRQAAKKSDQAPGASPAAADQDHPPYYRVKKDDHGIKDVQILQAGFVALLRRLGFRKMDSGEGFIIVRIVENVIEQYQVHQLRGFIVRYFHNLEDSMFDTFEELKPLLIEKLHRTLGTLTTEEKMSLLFDLDGKEEITLVSDTKDEAFFFYRNGWVCVTRDAVTIRPYKELPGCIWKDQILQRDFQKMPWKEWEKGQYFEFANNVSDNYPKPKNPEERNNPERFAAFMTITGYCLHKFFDTKLKMPIFLDARMTEEPDGRSGKSLHCKALRQLMNANPDNGKQCVVIDGKGFDPDNRFRYEDLHLSTRLFVIDDVRKGLPIDLFFNAIVDGVIRERKGERDKLKVWCKVILTLNYTISIRGGSARDRVVEFEFADFYSVNKTPEMVHGCWFFRDWDAAEWCRFDNFMLQCVSDYLRAGIIMPDTINLEARKLRDETNQEFIDWMEDLDIQHEKDYEKRELFEQWGKLDDHNKPTRSGFGWMKQATFTKWLKDFASYRPEIAGFREFRSSGKDYIRFFHNIPVRPDSLSTDAKSVNLVLFEGKSDKVVADTDGDKLPF